MAADRATCRTLGDHDRDIEHDPRRRPAPGHDPGHEHDPDHDPGHEPGRPYPYTKRGTSQRETPGHDEKR